MLNVFIFAELFAIVVIFIALALLIADDSGAREQKLMGYFLCGSLIQNAGYFLELTASTRETAIMSAKMQYLGSTFIPLCYCWFIFYYCYVKPPMKLLYALGVADFALLATIFSLDWHKLYYKRIEWLMAEDGHYYLSLEYGPAYFVFLVVGCVVPYCMTLYAMSFTRGRKDNRKYKTIMCLSILPVLALLAYACKLTRGFDMTPSVMGLVLSLVVILIWRQRTYDFRWMASEALLESMSDGVIALDMQNRILNFNRAAEGIFPKLGAHRMGDLIADVEGFPVELLEENAGGEFDLNERHYESHTRVILDKNNQPQGNVMLVLDVTDTRNYIEEIKRVREQAERANMAKSEFLANMSHEIRTPMNAIIGLSDIIIEESTGRKMYTYACDIKSASQNLLAIINDILDLSKVEAGKMELVMSEYHVKAVVDEVVHMMDIAASQRGLLMKYEYDTGIPSRYYGDEGRIKQILINLLNNAVKFTKEGYVKISIGGREGRTQDEELLVFQVQDTGCGIREEDREKIFENFKQVDSNRNRSVEGTGLGLSITKRLVQLMEGDISFESVYGEGTTFTVTIPQRIVDRRTIEEMPVNPVAMEEKPELFTAPDMKVLVVDDNLVNRKVAGRFLDTYGFELAEAASGFEAIELVKNTRYDIIFMDHMMPEMDGIEAVRNIRRDCGENGASPIIIALTANAMEGVREMFIENGFQDFLSKPLDRKRLNEALLKWIPEERRKAPKPQGDGQAEEEGGGLWDIRIEGIDMDAVIKHQSGSAEEYAELLSLYAMDGGRKLPLLRTLFDARDYKNYGIEVHALKSASANVGAMSLSTAARAHEEAANREDEAFIAGHFEELIAAYEGQLKAIRDFLDAREGNAETVQKLPEIDRMTLAVNLREALESLESFRSKECAAKVEESLRHRLDEDMRSGLKEVQELLKLYEDSKAENMLKNLINTLEEK